MNIPFDNPLFLIPSFTGIILIIAGLIMFKFPPKKINTFYGYRSKNSMKDQERWNFSQTYAAIEMMKYGGILSLSGIIGLLFKPNNHLLGLVLGLGIMILIIVFFVLRVEKEIKKRFDAK